MLGGVWEFIILAIVLILGLYQIYKKDNSKTEENLLFLMFVFSLFWISNESLLIWLVYVFFLLYIIRKNSNVPNRLKYINVYLLFILWGILSAFMSQGEQLYFKFSMLLKYFIPVLFYVAVTKSFKSITDIELFYNKILSFVPFYLMLAIIGFIGIPTLEFPYFTMSFFLLPLMLYPKYRDKKMVVLLIVLLLLPPIIQIKRTPLLACMLALSFFYALKYKIKSLFVVGMIVSAFVIAVFNIPFIKEKLFFSNSIELADIKDISLLMGNLNSNGRDAYWTFAYEKFYVGHEIIGSGTGSVKEFLRSKENPNLDAFSLLHNDLLHILCENGIIGIGIFVLFIMCIFIHLVKYSKKVDSIQAQNMAYGCCGLLIATITHMFFENSINSLIYSIFFINFAMVNKYLYLLSNTQIK